MQGASWHNLQGSNQEKKGQPEFGVGTHPERPKHPNGLPSHDEVDYGVWRIRCAEEDIIVDTFTLFHDVPGLGYGLARVEIRDVDTHPPCNLKSGDDPDADSKWATDGEETVVKRQQAQLGESLLEPEEAQVDP